MQVLCIKIYDVYPLAFELYNSLSAHVLLLNLSLRY